MIDGNTHALSSYEKRVQRFDMIESMFNSDLEPLIQELERIGDEIKYLVKHYEDEHLLDFSDDAHEAMIEALR